MPKLLYPCSTTLLSKVITTMDPASINAARERNTNEKVAEMKMIFQTKIMEMVEKKQGKNVNMFNKEKYCEKIETLDEIKQPGYRMKPEDYAIIKNFHVLDAIDKDGGMVRTLLKVDPKTGNKKRYVYLSIKHLRYSTMLSGPVLGCPGRPLHL